MQSVEASEQVYSNLDGDPDLADQVERFVAKLPQILATLAGHAEQRDWRGLQRVAHRLKGSSGCYGFDEVSVRANQLQETCRPDAPERDILAALAELERLCGRVRIRKRPK